MKNTQVQFTSLRWITSLVFLVLAHNASAQEVIKPIQGLFDAMRAHDGDKLLEQFTDSALLQRVEEGGIIRTTDIQKFATAIGKSSSYLDEHLLSVGEQRSGNLASVWTPYVFYRDKALSHCGVNSFQLVETETGWKIHYLIDNVYTGDCTRFIEQHTSAK